jgi:hypothetical protein
MDNIFGISDSSDLLVTKTYINNIINPDDPPPPDLSSLNGISYSVVNGVATTTIAQSLSVIGSVTVGGSFNSFKNSKYNFNIQKTPFIPNVYLFADIQKIGNIVTISWSTQQYQAAPGSGTASNDYYLEFVIPNGYFPNRDLDGLFYLVNAKSSLDPPLSATTYNSSYTVNQIGLLRFYATIGQTIPFVANDTITIFGDSITYISN